MMEKFDFKNLDLSKEPDQKKFNEEFGKLSKGEQENVTDEAHEEALETQLSRLLCEYDFKLNKKQRLNKALGIRGSQALSQESVSGIAEKSVIENIADGDINYVLKIIKAFDLNEDILKTPEAKNAAVHAIKRLLHNADQDMHGENIKRAIKIKKDFQLADVVDPLAVELIIESLSPRYIQPSYYRIFRIVDNFELPDNMVRSPDVQKAACEAIRTQFERAETRKDLDINIRFDHFIKMKEKLGLPALDQIVEPKKLHDAALKEVRDTMRYLSDDKSDKKMIREIEEIARECSLSEEDVRTVAKDFIVDGINASDLKSVLSVKDYFHIQEQEMQEMYNECFFKGQINKAKKIKEVFNLPESITRSPEIQKFAKTKILKDLLGGNVNSACMIMETAALPEATVREYAKAEVFKYLFNGKMDSASKIIEAFDLSETIVQSPEIQEIIGINYPQEMSYYELVGLFKLNQIGDKLTKSIYNLNNLSYPNQIKPLILAQGESAFLYFEAIKKIDNFRDMSPADIEYIIYVGKKYGTQSRNILENILSKVDSIGGERELVEDYIGEIGITHFDIYSEYKNAKETGSQAEIEKIKERVSGLQDKVYEGEMGERDFSDDMYKAVSYYTFPPAMGLTQEQYDQLNETRPDRRGDVPESLNELQYQRFEVSTGKFALGENEELNLEKWSSLGNAIKKVNDELEKEGKLNINEEEIAGRLIAMFKEKNSEKAENQDYLFESMYRYHLAKGGGRLESGFEISMEGLMKYKEFIGDRIKNDLIKDCLVKWRGNNEKEFEELKKDILNRIKIDQHKDFSKIKNMLANVEKQKDEKKKEQAVKNLDDFLKNYGLSYESVRDMSEADLRGEISAIEIESFQDEDLEKLRPWNYRTQEYYDSPEFIDALDKLLERHDTDLLVYRKISSDLIAGINQKMRKEVDKFEFEGETGKAERKELEFIISKKKEHGVAGYNMGVCVAPDEKLWNDPQFMNCIMFDPKLKQAMGGMHFLIRENNLCLPGINPSLDILGQVKNEELFDKMIEYAKRVKEKLGLNKILIPANSGIHSNRTQIQEVIRNKGFKQHKLKKEAKFSYSPYEYSFQDCLEVA